MDKSGGERPGAERVAADRGGADKGSADKPMHVVVRALSVLTHLSAYRQGLTLQQLHQQLEIPVGSMHRVMSTLEHTGFVSRSPTTKRYVLGPSAVSLGHVEDYEPFVIQPPAPLIEAERRCGESVVLTQLIDGRVVAVSIAGTKRPLRLFVRLGQEVPLHAAASARAILAYQDPAFVETLLSSYPRASFTSGTVREINRLIDHLAVVRKRGFDVCDNELDEGVWAVSAPVRVGPAGRVSTAVTVCAAWSRVADPADRADAARIVLDAAQALSREQGYDGPFDPDPTQDQLTALLTAADAAPDPFTARASFAGGERS
ncbi:IclR family transcriptional regulator [Actinacidiphila sp. ITFR-21]|uniref:IclR family transcriptional regulator n=1 Tax=Actinacidiphila sp. ITFR-21 TaxID=3075199 RepID=UPI00288A7D06|nr:IclR family transcriptional regulator C-terminal domain-containing protein [Streptomyces sp. ITFR-21]WNI18797.1 IclR family transcriptional regulator C-terminal domain-containing protein [Streptomyces sp. ITFR-21]